MSVYSTTVTHFRHSMYIP